MIQINYAAQKLVSYWLIHGSHSVAFDFLRGHDHHNSVLATITKNFLQNSPNFSGNTGL